jgi:hypothetical protein
MTVREILFALVILLPAIIGMLLLQRVRIYAGWRRRSGQLAGTLLILTTAVVSIISFGLRSSRMPAPIFTIVSPSSQYVARVVEPDGDAIPTSLVRISNRPAGHFFAADIYEGTVEPDVDWLDSQTLQLTYPPMAPEPICGGSWFGVKIVCREVSREGFRPRLRE